MAWQRQWTSKTIDVEVDLEPFAPDELLQGLIDRKWITPDEAEAIRTRATSREKASERLHLNTCPDDIELARTEALRGRRDEAMIYLARALGRDFDPVFRN